MYQTKPFGEAFIGECLRVIADRIDGIYVDNIPTRFIMDIADIQLDIEGTEGSTILGCPSCLGCCALTGGLIAEVERTINGINLLDLCFKPLAK